MKKIEIPKIETQLEVKNETDIDVAELYLYGTIRQAYWWDDEDDCISAKNVKNALKNITAKKINVHINSGGGDVFESIAIGNLLKQHNAEINMIVDSVAGSGASVVVMGADTIQMFSNSMMMIHKAWTYIVGNADELRKAADDLDKIDTAVKASYKDRFVGTDEELNDLFKDDSWLTADECVAFGFCDEIIANKKEEKEPENNIKQNLFNKYRKEINSETNLFQKFNKNGGKQ